MANINELKEMMLNIGVDRELVSRVDPSKPLTLQGVDSVDCPAFAVAVEKKYGVKIPDSESLKLKTLKDFENYINSAK
jgi:acyl carrier protein